MRLVFDRGTVLVEGDPDPAALAGIPGILWDPRVGAYRAPAWRHAEITAALTAAGVRFSDGLSGNRPAPGAFLPIALRSYQREAVDAWEHGGRRGLVVLPTGAGKTRVALEALARVGRPALCLVPTRVLLHQWRREIAEVYPHPIGQLGDGVHNLAPLTVSTYESAYRHMHTLGNSFELLVVDEAHHFGSGLHDEALEMCSAPARLGLTATPALDDAAAARAAALIGPTVYFLTVSDLAGTFLADFDLATLHVDLTPDERARYERLVGAFRAVQADLLHRTPGTRWRELAAAASRTAIGREALRAWRESWRLVSLCAAKRRAIGELLARHRESRVLVFTADNEAAYAIARAELVMPITCDIGRDERDAALARFRTGEISTLVSARVLNEGLDVPDADVAIVAGGSLGAREHVQRVGRLLRPRPGKRAVVYELVARGTLEVQRALKRRRGLAAGSATHLSNAG